MRIKHFTEWSMKDLSVVPEDYRWHDYNHYESSHLRRN